jgi:hypothetical protein
MKACTGEWRYGSAHFLLRFETEVMVSFTPGGALVLTEQEARLVWIARKEKSV